MDGLVYGVPVGTDAYCTQQLMKIARRIVSDAQQTAVLLAGERQALWTALRCSISKRFDYWLQMSYPSVVEPVARWLDSQLWTILETATGLTIPRAASAESWNCVLPVPVVGRQGRTFQESVVRQPVRLGGFGFRSLEDTAGPAFLGALEQSIPSFFGEGGICPQVSGVLGGEESYGDDAPETTRWRVMLNSGCREGEELRRVWSHMREEEQQAAAWLAREPRENLGVEVEGVGGQSTDGSTRGKVTQERDATRGELISKGLEVHPCQDRTNRPAWSWLQRDKLSTAWLQALPSPDTSLTSAEFSEAAAAALCLPSPACAHRLGEVVSGTKVVDPYGEAVLSATTLPGDHFRKRHDKMKMKIFQLCQWAGLEAEVEVFNLFAGCIPQQGLNRMERGRKRQSIVPDMRIAIPTEGNLERRLHEIKIISSSKSRYNPQREGQQAMRAVDKRAAELTPEYFKKARTTDRQYCGTEPGTTGPVETKLGTMGLVEGIVLGATGEGSEPLHSLIHHLALSRVRVAGPQVGRRGQVRQEAAEVAITTAFLRRAISVCGVRGQAWTLLDRLEVLGPGAAEAARRRGFALELERRYASQRRADALSLAQGRAVVRRGRFHLQ